MSFFKKILYLGNNTSDTDAKVSDLSITYSTTNHGLIDSENFIPVKYGLYHTSINDVPVGVIVKLADYFDSIVLLDQSSNEWDHPKNLETTFKLIKELESLGHNTVYKDNKNVELFVKFDSFLKTNKSFCIYPWINYVAEGKDVKLCARSTKVISQIDKLDSWQDNKVHNEIRQKMLDGTLLPDECRVCYEYESINTESYRTYETKEWINHLGISKLEDLKNITSPYYYEVRLSNKCNAMCRGCVPMHSHLIEKEFKLFNIKPDRPQVFEYADIDVIDIPTLTNKHRVYLTGGDPTVINEVMVFMQKCIDAGKTNFHFTLGTNGERFSQKFINLIKHFKINFSISLDGYGKVNDYWMGYSLGQHH